MPTICSEPGGGNGDRRPERVSWSYGFPLTYDQRVSGIEVTLGGDRVRRYELRYDADTNEANGEQYSPDSGASVLRSVETVGVTDEDYLPARSFQYQYNALGKPGFDGIGLPGVSGFMLSGGLQRQDEVGRPGRFERRRFLRLCALRSARG